MRLCWGRLKITNIQRIFGLERLLAAKRVLQSVSDGSFGGRKFPESPRQFYTAADCGIGLRFPEFARDG